MVLVKRGAECDISWKSFIKLIRRLWVNRLIDTESCFCHPLFNLQGTGEIEIRHTNFHFSSQKVT